MNYWKECITEDLEDAGINATDIQIDIITSWVDGAHENFGLATGSKVIPRPMLAEVKVLKSQMKKQQGEHERQLEGIRKGVAYRRNVDIGSVMISSCGGITYDH